MPRLAARHKRYAKQVGASQIVLGSDHPIPWEEHPMDHVFATTTLSDEEKVAILGGNTTEVVRASPSFRIFR